MLEAFGVSSAAETLYLHLLRAPGDGMDELARSLRWSTDEVRVALDELARLALLRSSRENPLAMRPVAPDIGLESLLARKQADLADQQHKLDQGRAALALLVAEYAEARPLGSHGMIEEIIGVEAVRARLETMTFRTRSEILALAPGGAQDAENLEAARPLDRQLLERGVTMRTVYLDSVRNDPPSVSYAYWLRELGGEVRTVPTLPLRMIVVDRATALIPIAPGDSSAGAAVLTGPSPVAAMCVLFDQIWRSAQPLGLPSARDENGLSPAEGELLRMLANGDTDEHIARRMAVSTRTVGRLASDLMSRLGTRSRFQMGVRAAELGWLSLRRPAESERSVSEV